MDHIDWLDAPAAKQVAQALGRQVVPGGRLILRSAALCPPYVRFIQEAGFEVLPESKTTWPCESVRGVPILDPLGAATCTWCSGKKEECGAGL